MSEYENEFPEAIYVKDPPDTAPDFIIAKLAVQINKFIEYLNTREGDYLNMQIKRSRNGKLYIAVDNWKPSEREDPKRALKEEPQQDSFADEDVPF